nr:cdp-diacylglycerol--glycerol-3-phosphate 3-phosphatidyltransferase [Quercus suber]
MRHAFLMLTGRARTCVRLVYPRLSAARSVCNNGCRRPVSSTAVPPSITASSSSASPLACFTTELDKLSPRFDVAADSIEILRSPTEFYENLKVDTIRGSLKRNVELKVSILTDALRGTREAPQPSCASLLASLVKEFGPERVEIRVYHTPNLTGIRKAILPKRINEGWGLQHMKLYGIDDEIIMSGANLSDDYFTNRQDRYHVFKSKDITEYFSNVHQSVCELSYLVKPAEEAVGGFVLEWPTNNVEFSPLADPAKYIASATRKLAPLARPNVVPALETTNSDTSVYPLLQLTPLLKPDTSTEQPAVSGVLRTLGTTEFTGARWTFTAGYFNMTPEFRTLLLRTRPSSATVIAASPWANGFYGSKGVSGMLPAAYTYLSRRFLDSVASEGLSEQISVKEWRKGTVNTPGGWTYHAKGIWVTLAGERHPSISLVGSSNYTKRSYSLDLEANTLIVTRNPDLQRRLSEEEAWLQEHAKPVSRDDYAKSERRVGLHVRIAMAIVTLVGGAL